MVTKEERERKRKELIAKTPQGLTPEGIPKAFVPPPSPFRPPFISDVSKRPPGAAPGPQHTQPDVAFFTDPKTGATQFAGPGAARERGELARTLEIQQQDIIKSEQAEQAKESAVDINVIIEQAKANVVPTGDVERDKLSFEQAIKSALSTAGISAAGSATVGAAAGLAGGPLAPITVPTGVLVGGGVGFITGLIGGMRSNLKVQKSDFIKGEVQNLLKTEQNMLKQVMLMNQLPRVGGTTDDLIEIKTMFDEQMALTDENLELLTLETSDDLSKWLGEDGHKQLEKYKNFNSPGGMRDILIKQMTLAINSPDLGRIAGLESQSQQLGAEAALE